nr:diguanylate cyclase [Butyrivibrio sp.]
MAGNVTESLVSNGHDSFFDHYGLMLDKIQKRFCDMAGVYACCLNSEGERITEFSGLTAETEFIKQYVTEERIKGIYDRVTESELEDQAVESTDVPNLKLAGIAVKENQKTAIVWIVCGIITDIEYDTELYPYPPVKDFRYRVTEKQFYRALDFIRDFTQILVKIEDSRNEAALNVEKSMLEQEEIRKSVLRAETTTEIVSLLDSDDSIEEIMAEILEKVATFLGISHAFVSRVHVEDTIMDIVVQWRISGERIIFDKTIDIDRCWFLNSSKTLAVSSDSNMSAGEKEQLDMLGMKAVVAMPIQINGSIGFYAAFSENRHQHIWSIDDIKFINDAVRILQNIIVKRIQRNSIASSFASLEAILDNVGSSIYVRDTKTGALLFANRSLRNNFSKELSDGSLELLFESSIPSRSKSGNYEVYHDLRDRWYELFYTRISWVDGRPVSLCAVYDITEKKMYQKRIEQQAYTDFLTGLYNRMCCERDLERYVSEARKYDSKGVICYLDLDDFKKINDTLGHQYGDILLQDISRAISNVDGIANSCYRMGGDEFVIIVPTESFDEYDRILEDVKHIFAKPWYLKDSDYYCTMSMGSVVFPDDGENVSDLIKKADIAMYEAKRSGKNRIAKYSDNIDASSIRRLDMEKSMRDAALENCKEFVVYFQPIIDVLSGDNSMKGAEALVRWNSSKLGFISPGEF